LTHKRLVASLQVAAHHRAQHGQQLLIAIKAKNRKLGKNKLLLKQRVQQQGWHLSLSALSAEPYMQEHNTLST
jgi:hypothetical protein